MPAIHELVYRSATKPELGFEIFTLRELYRRRVVLGEKLETPQRLDFHMIYVGTRGRGELFVDFAPTPIGKGIVTFVARGRVQAFREAPGVDACLLLVRADFLSPLIAPRFLSPDAPVPYVKIGGELEREVQALVAQLAAEYARPLDRFQPMICEGLLRAVLLRLERLHPDDPMPPPALARFRELVDRDFATTRSVAHYARAIGMSPRTLHALVAPTGRSPKELIDARVALELRRHLAHTDLAIKELAARTGFTESTNLVRFFVRHVGETPGQFRARYRK